MRVKTNGRRLYTPFWQWRGIPPNPSKDRTLSSRLHLPAEVEGVSYSFWSSFGPFRRADVISVEDEREGEISVSDVSNMSARFRGAIESVGEPGAKVTTVSFPLKDVKSSTILDEKVLKPLLDIDAHPRSDLDRRNTAVRAQGPPIAAPPPRRCCRWLYAARAVRCPRAA